MSDPEAPVERGLRATVRLAAGINIGESSDDASALDRARRQLATLIDSLHDRLAVVRRFIVFSRPNTDSTADRGALLRYAGFGAVAGAVVVAAGVATIAAHAALSTQQVEEIALAIETAATKADRLPLPVRAAAIADTVGAVVPGTGEMTGSEAGSFATASLSTMAFAPTDPTASGGNMVIDRVIDAPPTVSARLREDDEDDEAIVPLALPMPRARPNVEPTRLPLPKPRPLLLASLGPSSQPPLEVAPIRAAPPEAPPSGNVLGFFSSPTEPVKPPGRTKIDTPFGVPYVLQTGSVETACLKPELVDILRRIENRYQQKVVITSGFRDRGRQGSLHRQCAAVDIQINNVGAAELAAYARTVPGIGGVGTYCHPHMIHVDIGTPRDWKYGCGSYFAMRGAPGKWGKVPATMAKAQGTGLPQQIATDAQEED